MNTTVTAGINATNEDLKKAAQAQAQNLISCILNEQSTIDTYTKRIEETRATLKKLGEDVISAERVMGPTAAAANINQTTILDVITKMNEAKQDSLRCTAQRLCDSIVADQSAIKSCQDRQAGLRKQLNELEVKLVTQTAVLGA